MADNKIDFRRFALGCISFAFVGVGVSALFLGLESPFYWVLMRSGLFMGALWLALPEFTSQESKFTTPALLLGVALIVVLATRPKLFMVLGIVAIAAFFLQGVVRRFTAGLKK